jgi:hypothetical protein
LVRASIRNAISSTGFGQGCRFFRGDPLPPWDQLVVAAVRCPDEPVLLGWSDPWIVISTSGGLLRELGLPLPKQGTRYELDDARARLLVAAAAETGHPLPPGVSWEDVTTLRDAAPLALGVGRTQLYERHAAIRLRAAAPGEPNCCGYCRRPLPRGGAGFEYAVTRLVPDLALCPRCGARELLGPAPPPRWAARHLVR